MAEHERGAAPATVADRYAVWCAQRREWLGRIVREVWIEWAREQPGPKPSWLQPWDDLAEPEQEADRRIGERVAVNALATFARTSRTPTTPGAADVAEAIYDMYHDWTDGEPPDAQAAALVDAYAAVRVAEATKVAREALMEVADWTKGGDLDSWAMHRRVKNALAALQATADAQEASRGD